MRAVEPRSAAFSVDRFRGVFAGVGSILFVRVIEGWDKSDVGSSARPRALGLGAVLPSFKTPALRFSFVADVFLIFFGDVWVDDGGEKVTFFKVEGVEE
jgi:hypothetical protein